MNMNGKLAEMHFCMWLVQKGFDVFQPLDPNSPADVVWRSGPGSAWRSAQIKKVYRKYGKPTVNLTRSDGAPYRPQEVDYMACVDYEHDTLWIMRIDAPHPTDPGRKLYEFGRITLNADWDAYKRPQRGVFL
jgi:hypothetical protein